MIDRAWISEQVTRRLDYLYSDALYLESLMLGETFSEDSAERLGEIIARLQRVASAARPVEARHAAE